MKATTEKRAEIRQRVYKSGIISFTGAGVDCTVRNISMTGAQIEVPEATTLPPSFKLAIAADNFLRGCRLIWNKERRVGVAFD